MQFLTQIRISISIRLILRYRIDRIYILSFIKSPLRGFVFSNAKSGFNPPNPVVALTKELLKTKKLEIEKVLFYYIYFLKLLFIISAYP